jgi:hypothetical protein
MFGDAGGDLIAAGGASVSGGDDTFAFAPGGGNDVIGDFEGGTDNDVLDVQAFGFTGAAAVLALAQQVGTDTMLDLGHGTRVILLDFTATSLIADNILI